MDEAHFYINGNVNEDNVRYWFDKNPNVVRKKLLRTTNMTVFMGLMLYSLVRPYFFKDTVNGGQYHVKLGTDERIQLERCSDKHDRREYLFIWTCIELECGIDAAADSCHTTNHFLVVLDNYKVIRCSHLDRNLS